MFRKNKTSVAPNKTDIAASVPVFHRPAEVTNAKRQIPPEEYGPHELAFIGDAVYSLIAREILIRDAVRPAGELHRMSAVLVNAKAQAQSYALIEPVLTEEEKAVYRHGRNAKSTHTPKNQTAADYSRATGLEALFGYLYIAGRYDRLTELSGIIFSEKAEYEEKEQ